MIFSKHILPLNLHLPDCIFVKQQPGAGFFVFGTSALVFLGVTGVTGVTMALIKELMAIRGCHRGVTGVTITNLFNIFVTRVTPL